MADRYWVGGSGNWNATSTANWSTSSGGSAGASAPTSADNVIFDANSNTGTDPFTVTVTGTSSAPAVCNDFSTGGAGGALDGTMTLVSAASTSVLEIYGSLTLPATNFSWSPSNGLALNFRGTSTHTITTNGLTLNTTDVTINGVGGTYTLGSALTLNSTRSLIVTNGTFSTSASNYALSVGVISSSNSNTRTISFNASAITITGSSGINFSTSTNLTLNAGTSTITCSNASPTFTGGGLTYYNVTFSSAGNGTTTINGANTFNNLTQTSRSATGLRLITLGDNQTVLGTLTLGSANTAIRRIFIRSSVLGTRRTITLNGTLATLTDVDFRDIGATGTVATPWTGTRLGNCLNNNNITLDTPKTVYWNLSGTQNWSATGWATTNNGSPAVNNFPLAQDTAVFTEAGSAGTVTMDQSWQVGSIQMADGVSNRTTAFTLTISAAPSIYGNVTLFSNLTITGTTSIFFLGQGITQTITSTGVSWTTALDIQGASGTFKLADNLTNTGTSFTLTSGTLDLNNNTLTCVTFSSSNSNTRSISFGTGNITVTGSAATVFTTSTLTNLTITGTPVVNVTANASTGTRSITLGTGGLPEAQSISFNITAGSDTVSLASTGGSTNDVNFSGFTGTISFTNTIFVYGSWNSGGAIAFTGGGNMNFAATSGTKTIFSNGNTWPNAVNFNGIGGTWQLSDALTLGSTRTLTLTAGTLNANNQNCTTGLFASSNTNVRTLTMGSGTWTIQGAGVAWNAATSTNLTVNGGTSTITMTSASAKTFSGGDKTYYILNQGGAGALTIAGSNTFTTLSTAVLPTTITFTAGTTQSVGNFNLSGTSGNLVTIDSTSSGSQFNLYKISGSKALVSYMSIADSAATPSNIWFSPTSQGNVNGGNNTGWNFNRSGPALPNGFLLF